MITLIIPTRGRPDAAWQATESALAGTHLPDTNVVLAVDDNDPELERYMEFQDRSARLWVVVGPRERMGPTLNRQALRYAEIDPTGIVGFMGDDHRIRTDGWDRRVTSALSAPGVAYGDDQIHGPNLPTAAFVSSALINALGYIAPLKLVHLYLDNFWLVLGRVTHLEYLPDVVVEHLHPIAGKAEWDAGYVEVNSGETQSHDHQEFDRYMAEDWPTEQKKLER